MPLENYQEWMAERQQLAEDEYRNLFIAKDVIEAL